MKRQLRGNKKDLSPKNERKKKPTLTEDQFQNQNVTTSQLQLTIELDQAPETPVKMHSDATLQEDQKLSSTTSTSPASLSKNTDSDKLSDSPSQSETNLVVIHQSGNNDIRPDLVEGGGEGEDPLFPKDERNNF